MLSLENITLHAGDFALKNITFRVEPGSYFILLGPSGAGKSLILEMIAGFHRPVSGSIRLNNKEITDLPVQQRNVGLLFQDYAIFPHLSVFDNIAYPLRRSAKDGHVLRTRVERLAVDLEISHLLRRFPTTLSGGEQQRVALARTLAKNPAVLLLDEPLSSLDVQLRGGIRTLLRGLNMQGQTIVHVTHDYEEAAILGQQIAVIENNTIAQCGSHDEIFHHPRSAFVAGFVGIRNFFHGALQRSDDGVGRFMMPGAVIYVLTGQQAGNGYVVIKSEDIFLSPEPFDSSATNNLKGTITSIEPARLGFEITVDTGIPLIAVVSGESVKRLGLETGQTIWAGFKASAVRFVPE